jgi:hypothetical protein
MDGHFRRSRRGFAPTPGCCGRGMLFDPLKDLVVTDIELDLHVGIVLDVDAGVPQVEVNAAGLPGMGLILSCIHRYT